MCISSLMPAGSKKKVKSLFLIASILIGCLEDQELSMFALTRSPTITISGPTPVSLYGHPGWNNSGFPWTSVQKVFVNVQIKINRVDPEWKYEAFEVCLWQFVSLLVHLFSLKRNPILQQLLSLSFWNKFLLLLKEETDIIYKLIKATYCLLRNSTLNRIAVIVEWMDGLIKKEWMNECLWW